jgi:hypothetical protein
MPEPRKPKYNIGGPLKFDKIKSLLCSIGFHGKTKIEQGEFQQTVRVCLRCGETIKTKI